MSYFCLRLLSAFVLIVICAAHEYGHQSVKTYGGYIKQNDNQDHSNNIQQYKVPQYQPPNYGWNLNQPSRTYGGVIPQSNSFGPQNIGWAGNNQFAQNYGNTPGYAAFPTLPSMFRQNFMPPVLFPQYPFPYPNFQYPNFFQPYIPTQNMYPNNRYPMNQQPDLPGNTQTRNDAFLTNAFFGLNQPTNTNNVNRHWTKDDEMKWQATTKAPYFENKVPGLDCQLPASAVLNAMTALKISSLLPLNVPIGKHLLACNATGLVQAKINLEGIVYDCDDSVITLSCSNERNTNIKSDCQRKIIVCDTSAQETEVYCTNGTLISKRPIICQSASLTANKNVINCFYNDYTDNVPVLTTVRPIIITTDVKSIPTTLIPPPVPQEAYDDNVDLRLSVSKKDKESDNNLMPQLKSVMSNIFPQELMALPAQTLYLPPKTINPRDTKLSADLKNGLKGIFPYGLFAVAQDDDEVKDIQINTDILFAATKAPIIGSRNSNTRITDTSKPLNVQGSSAPVRYEPGNFNDRLIFSN